MNRTHLRRIPPAKAAVRPSIFLADGDAATRSRRASEAVDRKTKRDGKNPGTVPGLGRKVHGRDTDTAWTRSNSGVG